MITAFQESYYGNHSIICSIFNLISKLDNFEFLDAVDCPPRDSPYIFKYLRQKSFNKVENIPFYYLTGTRLPRNVLPNEYHIYIFLRFLQTQLQDLSMHNIANFITEGNVEIW